MRQAVVSGNQRQSVAIGRNQSQSVAISCHQSQSVAISGNQCDSLLWPTLALHHLGKRELRRSELTQPSAPSERCGT